MPPRSSWFAALLFAATASAAPLPEDLTGRQHVRGGPVEGVRESDELRQLRELDEQTFRATPEVSAEELVHPIEPPAWVAALAQPDLPVRFDERVLRYLEFYKSDKRGRAIMTSWLKKLGRWKSLFEDALAKAKLPRALVYVSMIESGFDPQDRSHAGAVGLWQFMPDGARIYGLRVDYWLDERRDPEKSTAAFVRYIADLYARFGGWPITLAAFNAGYGALLHAMQKYNSNDYWQLCKHEDGLPWETTLYVPKVMAVALVGENRGAFGYDDVAPEPAYSFDRVSVPSSTSLAAIAKAAESTPSEIAALNPELRRGRTPPEPWFARVPRGRAARFIAAFPSLQENVRPFVVRFGDRLEDIAAQSGAGTRELRALNALDDASEVRPGLTLVVPAGRKPQPQPPCATLVVAVPDKNAVVAGRKRIFYRTIPQDSPTDIAAFFKVKPHELAAWNHLDLGARLAGNMILQLWVAPDFDTSKAALVEPERVRVVTLGSSEFFDLVEAKRGRRRVSYVVKAGEDLARIGKRFGLSVADLERINRFGSNGRSLEAGQRLMVYVAMTAEEKARAACALTPGGLEPDPLPPPTARAPMDASKEAAVGAEPTPADAEERAQTLPRPPSSDGEP